MAFVIDQSDQFFANIRHDPAVILGSKTRAAVQAEQIRLAMPADAWPTRALLDRL